jgi:hypothetical protein
MSTKPPRTQACRPQADETLMVYEGTPMLHCPDNVMMCETFVETGLALSGNENIISFFA